MKERIIKSESLDALTAKTRHAEQSIGNCFIAFVRAPKRGRGKKPPAGFVVYGTDTFLGSYNTTQFHAFIVGSPDEKVKEIRAVIKFFHEHTAEATSSEDVHGAVIVDMLKDYNLAIIEDKNEPRANSTEVFVFDAHAHLYWISYAGQYGGQEVGSKRRPVVVRGCYDTAVRRRIEDALARWRSSPRRSALTTLCADLKRISRLRTVGFVPIT